MTAFGVGYGQGLLKNIRGSSFYWGGGFNITTIIKEASGCSGIQYQRTCLLAPATVEYDVLLTNDTIALRSGPDFGFNLAEHSNALPNAGANATTAGDGTIAAAVWQPRQDHVVTLTPYIMLAQPSIWSKFFRLLYEPMEVEMKVSPTGITYYRLIGCIEDEFRSNTSCYVSKRTPLQDLAKDFAVEPYNYSVVSKQHFRAEVNAQCAVYWRDPMQVCDAMNFGSLF